MQKKTTAREYLTFKIGEEIFAIKASKVREVMKQPVITNIPGMPDHLPGITNVRGNIIPVLQINHALNISDADENPREWLVICEARVADTPVDVGIPAISVLDVIRLEASAIKSPPDIGIDVPLEYIPGVFEMDESFIIIIDVEKVIATVYEEFVPMAGA